MQQGYKREREREVTILLGHFAPSLLDLEGFDLVHSRYWMRRARRKPETKAGAFPTSACSGSCPQLLAVGSDSGPRQSALLLGPSPGSCNLCIASGPEQEKDWDLPAPPSPTVAENKASLLAREAARPGPSRAGGLDGTHARTRRRCCPTAASPPPPLQSQIRARAHYTDHPLSLPPPGGGRVPFSPQSRKAKRRRRAKRTNAPAKLGHQTQEVPSFSLLEIVSQSNRGFSLSLSLSILGSVCLPIDIDPSLPFFCWRDFPPLYPPLFHGLCLFLRLSINNPSDYNRVPCSYSDFPGTPRIAPSRLGTFFGGGFPGT